TGLAGAAPLSTGAHTVDTGDFYVSESGGLTNYSAQLGCANKRDPQDQTTVTPGTHGLVSVATGDVIVCTFTNTRNQGTIQLDKIWSGTGGQTTLNIGTTLSLHDALPI